jgi:Arc/MetJ family transcription regulator
MRIQRVLKYACYHTDYTHTEPMRKAYAVTKRTSINLDLVLVDEAKAVLQTKETTETIHRALREVVRNERLRRLARRRFDFSDTDLDALRRSRTADAGTVSVSPKVTA